MISIDRRFSVSVAWYAVLILVLGAHARADSVAVTITPDPNFTFNNGFGYTLGYAFTANTDMTVTELGYFKDASFLDTHDVGMYTLSQTLLTSTSVTNTSTVIGNFAYTAITPVMLTAGQTYVIAGTSGLDDDYTYNPTSSVFAPSLTFLENRYILNGGGTLAFPDQVDSAITTGAFGPNFLFTTSAVPEPSTLLLGGLAMLGGLMVAWRRRTPRTA